MTLLLEILLISPLPPSLYEKQSLFVCLFIYNLLSHVQSDGWKTSAAPTQVFEVINLLTDLLVQQIHLVYSYL